MEADYAPARVGEIRHSVADVSHAESVLGYQVQVDFAGGIARTLSTWPA